MLKKRQTFWNKQVTWKQGKLGAEKIRDLEMKRLTSIFQRVN